MKKTGAYAAGAVFALIVGFSFVFVKKTLNYGEPLVLLAYRFDLAFAAAAVWVFSGLSKINLKKPGIGWVMTAALTYGGFMIFQLLGLRFATSVEGGILFAIVPVLTMIIAGWLLKEKTNKLQKAFVVTSVTGVLFLLLISSGVVSLPGSGAGEQGGWEVSVPGIALLLIASMLIAVSNTTLRYIRGRFTPMEISFVMLITCAALFSGAAFVVGAVNGHLARDIGLAVNLPFLAAAAYLGILSTFVTSFLMNYMMVHLKAVEATLFGNLSTAISILAGALIIGEPVYAYHIICTGLIIAGVLGTSAAGNRTDSKTRRTNEETENEEGGRE